MDYANFTGAFLEDVLIAEGRFRYAIFSEMRLKKTVFEHNDLSGAEFFRTMLRGVDLSGCEISGIVVSDSMAELKGVKIAAYQAVQIAEMLGMKIV